MNEQRATIVAILGFSLTVAVLLLTITRYESGKIAAYEEIEKKCLYGEHLEFSGQLFSCQWLEGVTKNDVQYERKPHPNKEVLK